MAGTRSAVLPLLVLSLFFSFSKVVLAHSGRTDSSGGHNCNVGSCAGTYHYHNGGSASTGTVAPTSVPIVYPTSVPIVYPTKVPTRVPTRVVYPTATPTVVPTLVPPTLIPTKEVVSDADMSLEVESDAEESEVLGVVDEEVFEGDSGEGDSGGSGGALAGLGMLGGLGWAGWKKVRTKE